MLGYLNIPKIDVYVAETVEEAVKALAEEQEREIIAAGTEIITSLTNGEKKTRKFIDISKITELKKIDIDRGRATVGALVTHNTFMENFRGQIPAVETFHRKYSSPAVSHRATVGGSVMLRRSSEDLIPILLCLDAELFFETVDGSKVVPLDEFVRDGSRLVGILRHVSFRVSEGCYFDKLWMGVSRFPLISVAVDIGQRRANVAVSHKEVDRPGRVYSVEKFLENRPLNRESVERAGEILSHSINPVEDIFASKWYRRRVAGVLLKRLLTARIGGVV